MTFMGETGSLLPRFVVVIFAIRFNELNVTDYASSHLYASPAISFSILFVILFDTLRLSLFRVYRKSSPFAPDRTHIHHLMLSSGFSHSNTTFVLMAVNIAVVEIAWYFQYLGTMKLTMLLLLTGTILTSIPYIILARRNKIARVNQVKVKIFNS